MRHLKFGLIGALMLAAPVLAGCDVTSQDASATAAVTQAADTVKAEATKLQQLTAQVCGYVPTAATAANLIGTLAGFGGLTTTLTGLAQEFCTAVTTQSASKGSGGIKLRGVVLHYRKA